MHEPVNYKKKYKTMKKKLRFIVFEQECFLEELRKSQRRLLKVSRDRNFLLDRLLQYEKIDDQSSDSEATASSESESEAVTVVPKKKKTPQQATGIPGQPSPSVLSSVSYSSILTPQTTSGTSTKIATPTTLPANILKRAKVVKKIPKGAKVVSSASTAVHMTREELERHLEMKQSTKPTFMSLEKTPNSLPDDIFMN